MIKHSECSTAQLSIDLPSLAPAALQKHTEVVLAVLWDPSIPPLGKRRVLEMIELFATDRFVWDMWEAVSPATGQECRVLLDRMRALDEPIPFTLAEG
ncbi:MAG: hypothetical protein JWO63_1128 [Frankiales bacterium]|jgi:hypothetical protein|nr:hypothetical protein [Frankiales bacterium]